MPQNRGMDTVTWSSFLGRAGQPVSIDLLDTTLTGEIVEVERTDTSGGGTLSVLIAVPAGAPEQGTYLVRHDELGEFPLFLVPRSATQVEAVFTWLDAP